MDLGLERSGRLPALLILLALECSNPSAALAASQVTTPSSTGIEMSSDESAGMGCLVGAAVSGAATLLIGSVAIVVTGGTASAAETAVAIPVLVGTTSAGCSLGAAMMPGLSWMRRESLRIVD